MAKLFNNDQDTIDTLREEAWDGTRTQLLHMVVRGFKGFAGLVVEGLCGNSRAFAFTLGIGDYLGNARKQDLPPLCGACENEVIFHEADMPAMVVSWPAAEDSTTAVICALCDDCAKLSDKQIAAKVSSYQCR